MFIGELNLACERPPEVWGRAGVLKYPHGAVLHALQTLPILNWLLTRWNVKRRVMMLQLTIAAHFLFLVHSTWQTWNGHSRLDLDLVGGTTLILSVLLLLVSVTAITIAAFHDVETGNRSGR